MTRPAPPSQPLYADEQHLPAREMSLAQHEAAELCAVIQSMPDGVVIGTAEGITTANQIALDLLGVTDVRELNCNAAERASIYDVREADGITVIPPDRWPFSRALGGQRSVGEYALYYRRTGRGRYLRIAASPIRLEGTVLGAVAILTDVTERRRTERELAEAFEREHRITESLQRSMLLMPPEDAFPGLHVANFYESAEREALVGGDFMDAFSPADDYVALVVGDASGKGIEAAARTAEVRFALRAYLRGRVGEPDRAVVGLNQFLCDFKQQDQWGEEAFVALSLAVLHLPSGRVQVVRAGAEFPFIVAADGSIQTFEEGSLPLGVRPDASYTQQRAEVEPGGAIVLMTDGITEARKGDEFFGYERMLEAAQAHAGETARGIGRAIMEAAQTHAGGRLDDDACLQVTRFDHPTT